ncbi:ABC transporter ATP-binding protein [Helcococcus bovis]|uniref:ABC transporter ATP-binding protein n=1 Tax=Helcococcus bovis TaxID=3153252 RepID=UPI0038B99AAC
MKLSIQSLKKNFSDKEVLRNASYEFENGKIYGLLGRNGAGKTTLFNILYSELEKDDGDIKFFDDEALRNPKVEDIGMVFAETHLPDFLTAYEYIKFIIDINNPNELFKIDTYFDEMSIEQEDRHRLLKDFSSGMKAKVALLAIYIQKPKIILLDEPLTAVDVVSASEIKKFFRSLKDDHIVIISTHMLDLAKDLCDEIVLLHNGRLQSLSNLEKDENYESKIVEALKEEKDV